MNYSIKSIIIIVILHNFQTNGTSQTLDSSLKNYYDALTIVKKSIETYGGESRCRETIGFNMAGQNYVGGHFDTPEKSIAAPDSEKIVFHSQTQCVQYYGDIVLNSRKIQTAAFVRPDSSFNLELFSGSVDKANKDAKKSSKLKELSGRTKAAV